MEHRCCGAEALCVCAVKSGTGVTLVWEFTGSDTSTFFQSVLQKRVGYLCQQRAL